MMYSSSFNVDLDKYLAMEFDRSSVFWIAGRTNIGPKMFDHPPSIDGLIPVILFVDGSTQPHTHINAVIGWFNDHHPSGLLTIGHLAYDCAKGFTQYAHLWYTDDDHAAV